MSMTDPIADMLTRIRNAQSAEKQSVTMPYSKLKSAICAVLNSEGYVGNYERIDNNGKAMLRIDLKYFEGKPVISKINRVSRPGRRVYSSSDEIPVVDDGLGVSIVSTSRGVMTDRAARKSSLGGEVICQVA